MTALLDKAALLNKMALLKRMKESNGGSNV
jgi:hypothetical protein